MRPSATSSALGLAAFSSSHSSSTSGSGRGRGSSRPAPGAARRCRSGRGTPRASRRAGAQRPSRYSVRPNSSRTVAAPRGLVGQGAQQLASVLVALAAEVVAAPRGGGPRPVHRRWAPSALRSSSAGAGGSRSSRRRGPPAPALVRRRRRPGPRWGSTRLRLGRRATGSVVPPRPTASVASSRSSPSSTPSLGLPRGSSGDAAGAGAVARSDAGRLGGAVGTAGSEPVDGPAGPCPPRRTGARTPYGGRRPRGEPAATLAGFGAAGACARLGRASAARPGLRGAPGVPASPPELRRAPRRARPPQRRRAGLLRRRRSPRASSRRGLTGAAAATRPHALRRRPRVGATLGRRGRGRRRPGRDGAVGRGRRPPERLPGRPLGRSAGRLRCRLRRVRGWCRPTSPDRGRSLDRRPGPPVADASAPHREPSERSLRTPAGAARPVVGARRHRRRRLLTASRPTAAGRPRGRPRLERSSTPTVTTPPLRPGPVPLRPTEPAPPEPPPPWLSRHPVAAPGSPLRSSPARRGRRRWESAGHGTSTSRRRRPLPPPWPPAVGRPPERPTASGVGRSHGGRAYWPADRYPGARRKCGCQSRRKRERGPPERGSFVREIRRRPTLPGQSLPSTIGAGGLNFRVRNGNGCDPSAMATENLLSRGRRRRRRRLLEHSIASTNIIVNPSPRPISTGRLNTLPCFHLRPINVIVYHGPYQVNPVGNLILERASHLDAFSAYPFRRSLTSSALGSTTGTQELRPSRSSRTRDSIPQIPYGCGG